MRDFVINEETLNILICAAQLHSDDITDEFMVTFQSALTACRARPVQVLGVDPETEQPIEWSLKK